jgi:26S proteasome regulatory subunit N8
MPVAEQVSVHPLVLLSVVDHYNRVAKETKKRVVGVLLGSVGKDGVDVTNSFAGTPSIPGSHSHAMCSVSSGPCPYRVVWHYVNLSMLRLTAVPFEEDSKDPTIWFMDHSYMENMSRMFRKVNGVVLPADVHLGRGLQVMSQAAA